MDACRLKKYEFAGMDCDLVVDHQTSMGAIWRK